MDEPIHSQESLFWDRVADWLLGIDDARADALSPEELAAFGRAGRMEGDHSSSSMG